MHTKDARARGESEQRLYALSAWRETTFFTKRERAAPGWTEALTRIYESGVLDDARAPPGESSGKPEPARAPSPATIAEGESSAEIATVLFLSPKTVDTYRSRMMHKLGSGDLPHLVKFAIQHGVTQLD